MQLNNNFQTCRNSSDAVPLYLPQRLYLKPIARMNITVHLPEKKPTDKAISNWEIMEKLRVMIAPEEFSILKVTKCTLEFIRFEAEIEEKSKLERTVHKLNDKTIKLNGFLDLVKVKAAESKSDFPTRHTWDSFFRDTKEMNEMKPGERPDTVHLSNLPIKWFIPSHYKVTDDEDFKPSEKLFHRIFEKFGSIRHVDIPICDPYRSKMKAHMSGMQTFTFDQHQVFEGYVQFKDYVGFTKLMDALRGMKLLRKEKDEMLTISILVDFDRTKHLSDASIRRRQIVRDRLISLAKEKEQKEKKLEEEEHKKQENERLKEIQLKKEKDMRQRRREEKRKSKQLAKLKNQETDELNIKIAKEEKKLLKAQIKLEAIRLLEELFNRIKDKKEIDEKQTSKKKHDKKVINNELTKMKVTTEENYKQQKEKLNKSHEDRIILKSLLATKAQRSSTKDSSSSDSDSRSKDQKKKKKKASDSDESDLDLSPEPPREMYPDPASWYSEMYPYHPMYPHMARHPMMPFPFRGMKMPRNGSGSSRGFPFSRRGRGGSRWPRNPRNPRNMFYGNPDLHHEYVKYFEKFIDKRSRSRSRTRSRSTRRRSRSRNSRSRSRRRSYTRSRSRSRSRSRTRSRKSRSRSRSRSRSHRSTRSKSDRKQSVRKSRSRTPEKRRSRSRSKKSSRRKSRSRSPSYKSIDSSKFISPSRMRQRSRSKSWSMPREGEGKQRDSWSKSKTPSLKSD